MFKTNGVNSNKSISKIKESISYTWIIDHFNELKDDVGNPLYSPVFPESNQSSQWKISLHPKGMQEEDPEHCSLFLKCIYCFDLERISANYCFNILDSGDQVVLKSSSSNIIFKTNESWGTKASISKIKQHVINDQLKIWITIETDFERVNLFKKKDFDPVAILTSNLESLLTSHKFSDFVIKVDNTELAVHKAILAARSPVFSAMLESNLLENNLGYMEIKDCDRTTITLLLQFVYSGRVDIPDEEEAKKLFVAADKYELLDLKKLCGAHLSNKFDNSNISDILILADRHGATDLKIGALDYVIEHIHEFSDQVLYENLFENAPRLLIELLGKISKNKS